MERSSSRLTSTVKPLMELLPSEAVIDIKPEMDDDLIAEDPVEIGTNHGRARGSAGRPTAEIYRAGQSKLSSVSSADTYRSTEESSHSRQQDSRSIRTSRTGSSKVCTHDAYSSVRQLEGGIQNNNFLSSLFNRRSFHESARRL